MKIVYMFKDFLGDNLVDLVGISSPAQAIWSRLVSFCERSMQTITRGVPDGWLQEPCFVFCSRVALLFGGESGRSPMWQVLF